MHDEVLFDWYVTRLKSFRIISRQHLYFRGGMDDTLMTIMMKTSLKTFCRNGTKH